MSKNNYFTISSSRLFARPSFTEGVSRGLDLGATLQAYNTSQTDEEADTQALQNDWKAVGDDLSFSIKLYEQQISSTKTG